MVAVGSGGTLAGLAAGNAALGRPWTLAGASASRPPTEMSRRVLGLATECLALLGSRAVVTGADIEVADVRGPGHGLPSAEGAAAAAQAVRTEGLMTDPVYTAKALSPGGAPADGRARGVLAHRRHARRGGRGAGCGAVTAAAPPVPGPAAGPPSGPPSAELIAAGFALENADAPVLHHGINLADLAHLLDLGSAGVIPPAAARRMLALVLDAMAVPASEFPYDPANGEPYNSREKYFAERAGDVAGWLHAGRPRREAIRIAFRLRLRDDLARLIEAAAGAGRRHRRPGPRARHHADGRPDLPAARAAVHVRALCPLVRLPGAARPGGG